LLRRWKNVVRGGTRRMHRMVVASAVAVAVSSSGVLACLGPLNLGSAKIQLSPASSLITTLATRSRSPKRRLSAVRKQKKGCLNKLCAITYVSFACWHQGLKRMKNSIKYVQLNMDTGMHHLRPRTSKPWHYCRSFISSRTLLQHVPETFLLMILRLRQFV
jgi:hypothetical protein